ncbi:hypothetical protein SFUMM280S_01063 [Streptomyces fumanus]
MHHRLVVAGDGLRLVAGDDEAGDVPQVSLPVRLSPAGGGTVADASAVGASRVRRSGSGAARRPLRSRPRRMPA